MTLIPLFPAKTAPDNHMSENDIRFEKLLRRLLAQAKSPPLCVVPPAPGPV